MFRAGERERHEIISEGNEGPQLQFQNLSLPHLIQDIAKEFLHVMKAEKSCLKKQKESEKEEKRPIAIVLAIQPFQIIKNVNILGIGAHRGQLQVAWDGLIIRKHLEIEKIIDALRKFRDERDWRQFHNAKDLALAINVESSELLELFLWKNADDADVQRVKEELADVFIFSLFLADKYGLNVSEIINEKLASSAKKYPIDKAKGNAKKYNEL